MSAYVQACGPGCIACALTLMHVEQGEENYTSWLKHTHLCNLMFPPRVDPQKAERFVCVFLLLRGPGSFTGECIMKQQVAVVFVVLNHIER